MTAIFWFHRDHRLSDNEALAAALTAGQVLPVAVLDMGWLRGLSSARAHSWVESLRALDTSLPAGLEVITVQDEAAIAPALVETAQKHAIGKIFATKAYDPDSQRRQSEVAKVFANAGGTVELVGSHYAVAPGMVRKPIDGTPYRVYTPFYRAWSDVGWQRPIALPQVAQWVAPSIRSDFRFVLEPAPFPIRAGEDFAKQTFEKFAHRALGAYREMRDRADLSGTSHLSHALAHGEIHPRTLLAALGDLPGHETFRKEIAWREFYADVLFWNPKSQTEYLDERYRLMRYDSGPVADSRLDAWRNGLTGYPMVDAGMRQLQHAGWMHNRVRMIVASFLVKDLHLEWQLGASQFEQWLTDFDPASNSHGWQWTAGCGTDASPYFRVFNPVLQGLKFDPSGDYVRRWIPELRHIAGPAVHEPWNLIDGGQYGYPAPIVDHATERDEALRRLEELKVRAVKP